MSRFLVSCLTGLFVNELTQEELCLRVPDFFYPQAHPCRHSSPKAREIACRERLEWFASALEVSVDDIPRMLPAVEEANTALQALLAENAHSLSTFISRFRFTDAELSRPFDSLATALGRDEDLRPVAGLFLQQPISMENIRKAVLLASASDSLNLLKLVQTFCKVLSAVTPQQGRFTAVCASPSVFKFAKHLETGEIAYIINRIPVLEKMHITLEIRHFIIARHLGHTASAELIESVREIPVEIHPLYVSMCINFQIAFLCGAVVARHSLHSSESLVEPQIPAPVKFENFDRKRNFLGFEIEAFGRLSEFEDSEISDPGFLRVCSLSAFVFPSWPLLKRVCASSDAADQTAELELVSTGRIGVFIDGVARSQFGSRIRKTELVRLFAEFPLEQLKPLLDRSRPIDAEVSLEVIRNFRDFVDMSDSIKT